MCSGDSGTHDTFRFIEEMLGVGVWSWNLDNNAANIPTSPEPCALYAPRALFLLKNHAGSFAMAEPRARPGPRIRSLWNSRLLLMHLFMHHGHRHRH